MAVHGELSTARRHGDGCICGRIFRLGAGSAKSPRSVATIQTSSQAPDDAGNSSDDAVVSVSTLASWLQHCEAEHDRCKAQLSAVATLLPRLLVIDVKEMRLAEASTPRYFALSYVWGPAKVFMTMRSEFPSLCEPGALAQLGDKLPLLLQDAILLVQRLGERYLWVDSLCIIQDATESKQDLIGKMDLIYANAVCTIIAHGSVDASSPIPGVRTGTRRPIQAATPELGPGDGVRLVASPSHYSACPLVYDTRGWTYQEQLVSRRRLIMGADQAFFSCCSQRDGELSEDPLTCTGNAAEPSSVRLLDQEGECISLLWNLNPDAVGATDLQRSRNAILKLGSADAQLSTQQEVNELIYTFTSTVTHYSSRRLSFASDILNAFAGVMTSIERSYGLAPRSSIYGLLEKYLHYNLHWTAKTPLRRLGWPSWSWVGWESQVHWLGRDNIQALQLKIRAIHFLWQGALRTIPPLGSALSAVSTDDEEPASDVFPHESQPALLDLSHRAPLLAFWATVSRPGSLHVCPHPIRQTKIRICASPNYVGVCGHLYEEFDWALPQRPTAEVFASFRLVYLSYSSRRCVFHVYDDSKSCRSCNVMVIDTGEGDELKESGCLYAERVAFGEVCGSYWDVTETAREFVVLA
ncbi:heterokaryon incompatibility protein [Lasiosphaeria ovina]|uniref:Heterokaryon incompatibility protein n=1 Tax=Lasiosphaeria ovina TaxID=92902 RepID=A0AAE0NBI0_9PEZI|nr:heterokaryon incompatibility protein [Lasiosphaeria ovina]